jgi:hypothetical protein
LQDLYNQCILQKCENVTIFVSQCVRNNNKQRQQQQQALKPLSFLYHQHRR